MTTNPTPTAKAPPPRAQIAVTRTAPVGARMAAPAAAAPVPAIVASAPAAPLAPAPVDDPAPPPALTPTMEAPAPEHGPVSMIDAARVYATHNAGKVGADRAPPLPPIRAPASAKPTQPTPTSVDGMAWATKVMELTSRAGFPELGMEAMRLRSTLPQLRARIEAAQEIKMIAGSLRLTACVSPLLKMGFSVLEARELLFELKATAEGATRTDTTPPANRLSGAPVIVDAAAVYSRLNARHRQPPEAAA